MSPTSLTTPRRVAIALVAPLTAVGVSLTASLSADARTRDAAQPVRAASQEGAPPPPMVSLLFSRSPLGNAVNCVADRTAGTVWLDTTVAPELARRGLKPVGTVETRTVGETTRPCYHYQRTIAMSWQDMAHYRDTHGWTFISHGQTRVELTTVTDAELERQVSGSLQDLRSHGHLKASGMYAYQNNRYDDRTQQVVRRYYDFGRTYKQPATTAINTHANVDPSRFQWTSPLGGGRCRQAVAACTNNVYTTVSYRNPAVHVNAIKALRAGDWLSIQSYVFVDGYRKNQWDCRSSDPRLHWTFDGERYCWKDYLKVLDALASRPDIVVTDPYSVARAWYPTTVTPQP